MKLQLKKKISNYHKKFKELLRIKQTKKNFINYVLR